MRCAPKISRGNAIAVRNKKITARSTRLSGRLDRRIITPTSDINKSCETANPASTKLVRLLSILDAVITGMYISRKPEKSVGAAVDAAGN